MSTLSGLVLDPSCPGWEAARRNFRLCVDYSRLVPKNIVFCQHSGDVRRAVVYPREAGIPLRARSGRHSYEAFSLVKDGIIIDPSLPEDHIQHFPGLEFQGRNGIQQFLETRRGRKCKKTALFYAFGWGGMKSPSFRKSWDDVRATMMEQSEAKR